jgi:hypothetical protein
VSDDVTHLWTVDAVWVPAGARVADGLKRRLYCGTNPVAASGVEQTMRAWARGSTCGGTLLTFIHIGPDLWEKWGERISTYRGGLGVGSADLVGAGPRGSRGGR